MEAQREAQSPLPLSARPQSILGMGLTEPRKPLPALFAHRFFPNPNEYTARASHALTRIRFPRAIPRPNQRPMDFILNREPLAAVVRCAAVETVEPPEVDRLAVGRFLLQSEVAFVEGGGVGLDEEGDGLTGGAAGMQGSGAHATRGECEDRAHTRCEGNAHVSPGTQQVREPPRRAGGEVRWGKGR